jgi:hypothetical protein
MHRAKAYLSVFWGFTLSIQVVAAQIGLPIPRRQPPARPPVGGPAGQQAQNRGAGTATVEQCKALTAWAAILDREYPPAVLRSYPVDGLSPRALNLFRDEYFRLFYGKTFSQTTDQERQQYLVTVFRGCGANQVTPQELAPVQKYRQALEYPFQYGSPTAFAGQEFAKKLAERQTIARWKDDTLRGLNAVPATLEGIDRLEGFRQKGEKDLESLFPSEKRQFLQAVNDRRKLFLPALAEQLLAIAGSMPAGPDGAKALTALRARYEPLLADADPAIKARVTTRLDELAGNSVKDKIQPYKSRLGSTPQGIQGVLALNAWQKDFDVEFAGMTSISPVEALQAEANAKRSQCLTQGLTEFKAMVADYPKPGPGGKKADEMFAALFPNGQSAQESAPYYAALQERTRQIQKEQEAKEFREEVARYNAEKGRKPATQAAKRTPDPNLNPCDDLAGHPGDPGVKGEGVSDAELNAADAIKACALAVKQQPKNARFRFQLGRAYWAGKQYDRAVEALSAAQGMEYAPAYHYLGLAYEQGKVKGEAADKAFAKDLYRMAVAGGFNAEAAAIGAMPEPSDAKPVETADDLDEKEFKEPAFVKALFSGDFAAIQGRRRWVLVWASGIQSFMALDPNEFDPTCLKLFDASLDAKIEAETGRDAATGDRTDISLADALTMLRRGPASIGVMASELELMNRAQQNGVDDINVLQEDYGRCEGPVVRRFYRNLVRFVKEKPQSSSQPKQFAQLSGPRDRPPQASDVRGISDPALLARLQQEVQGLASKGFVLTECNYGAPEKTIAYWKNAVPLMSDSLRIALTNVLPMSLAHCGKHENYTPMLRNLFLTPSRHVQLSESTTTMAQLTPAAFPRMLPASQRSFPQEAAGIRTAVVSCKSNFEALPVLYWKTSLPQIQGQVNSEFLQFVYTYWKVLPVAVNGCPASSSASMTYSFRDF